MTAAPEAPSDAARTGLGGEGAPLEAGVRDLFSTAFRQDFSAVRVHDTAEAHEATGALGALAYTVGNDIAFAPGVYDPLSSSGRAVIGHELAHVAQHGGRAYAPNFLLEGGAVPEADHGLEHQAHTAAHTVGEHGRLPTDWSWQHAHRPFLGRLAAGWTAPPAPYSVSYADTDRPITQEQWSEDQPDAVRINLGAFVLPLSKGPWRERYHQLAQAGALQATLAANNGRLRAAAWQQRAPSDELRRAWLLHVGWTETQAKGGWWEEAGGDPIPAGGEFRPKVGQGKAVQIDHIVELQVGGSNVPDNLAPHTSTDNEASGREIWTMLRAAGADAMQKIKDRPGGRAVTNLTLAFDAATQVGSYPANPNPPALPATGRDAAIAQRRGRAPNGLTVHFTAVADKAAGTRPSTQEAQATAAGIAALADYPLRAGNGAVLKVPATPPSADRIENSEVPANHAARELIPALVLAEVRRKRPGQGQHVVVGYLNDDDHPVRSGSRLPIALSGQPAKKFEFVVHDPGGEGRLAIKNGTKRIQFTYPYLSAGTMDVRTDDTGQISGHGTITPSVPLLRRAPITVDWDRSGLRGSVAIDKDRLSLPPFRVTDAALTVQLAPELRAGGHLDFELARVVRGRLEATADSTGFRATGRLSADIPGLDSAEAALTYRPSVGLTGEATARASSATGLVRGGSVTVRLLPHSQWTAEGQVDLALPGSNPATLTVHKEGNQILYGGHATLTVPGLRPVDVHVQWDGRTVTGTAHTGFTVLGVDGDLDLRYREGRFSGTGSVALQRGPFTGSINAELHPDGVITGTGRGSVQIRPGLVATLGLEYGRDRRLKTTGEITFPTYRFLEARGARRELFSRTLPPIPLFAIPLGIGSVGLVATVGGSMAARYSFGPGELREMVIRGSLYPLEQDMQAELSAHARLVIPAEAGLELSARVGIGASVVIATASGGITITGGVLLRGGLDAGADLRYAQSLLTFDALARISVEPILTLRADADLRIEAIGGSPSWVWPYQLAAVSYPTGLVFGMEADFHYRSDQPLQLPSAENIRWIIPNIDVMALGTRLAGQVRTGLHI